MNDKQQEITDIYTKSLMLLLNEVYKDLKAF